jgi:allophanate hydrolase subunit 1
MKIGLALHELHRSENELAEKLLHVSDRHKVDHEIHYVARDIARWSQDHVRQLAEAAKRYDVDLDPEPREESRLMERVRDAVSDATGREPQASLLVLVDLREVYLRASGVSVDWELVAQAAQGVKDASLVALTKRCHPENLRQARWANGKLKEAATQILVS